MSKPSVTQHLSIANNFRLPFDLPFPRVINIFKEKSHVSEEENPPLRNKTPGLFLQFRVRHAQKASLILGWLLTFFPPEADLSSLRDTLLGRRNNEPKQEKVKGNRTIKRDGIEIKAQFSRERNAISALTRQRCQPKRGCCSCRRDKGRPFTAEGKLEAANEIKRRNTEATAEETVTCVVRIFPLKLEMRRTEPIFSTNVCPAKLLKMQ